MSPDNSPSSTCSESGSVVLVADAAGNPRVVVSWSDTNTTLDVLGPAGDKGALASLCISENELVDDDGRGIGVAAITTFAAGTPGASLLASEVDGDRDRPVTERQVIGSVEVYDGTGRDAIAMTERGLIRPGVGR